MFQELLATFARPSPANRFRRPGFQDSGADCRDQGWSGTAGVPVAGKGLCVCVSVSRLENLVCGANKRPEGLAPGWYSQSTGPTREWSGAPLAKTVRRS